MSVVRKKISYKSCTSQWEEKLVGLQRRWNGKNKSSKKCDCYGKISQTSEKPSDTWRSRRTWVYFYTGRPRWAHARNSRPWVAGLQSFYRGMQGVRLQGLCWLLVIEGGCFRREQVRAAVRAVQEAPGGKPVYRSRNSWLSLAQAGLLVIS